MRKDALDALSQATPDEVMRMDKLKAITRQMHERVAIVNEDASKIFVGGNFEVEGKRESVHLLSTLYIKQLPLPSTILPIRGTLGLFQGVVFESDFCHTNFRTTVAYDKFTNNF